MRTTMLLITIATGFGILAVAQDDAQYKAWMKSVAASVGAIRKAADSAAAAPDANTLADTFDKVTEFWKARNAPDAVQFAETARDTAKAIAAGNGDKAANLQKLQAQCGGCHKAHREGTAPNFTIK
jgi:hypothetical protein